MRTKTNSYFLDEVKANYKSQCGYHQVHYVNQYGGIALREEMVADFAVKVKITEEAYVHNEFRNEMRRYLETLRDSGGDDSVDISQLIVQKKRVTFVRGIAGIGKSILAKQLTYNWATDAMYTNFKLCIMFECRDLNHFRNTKGAELKKHEIVEEFIKANFSYNLEDGKGILFVVDGLDELYDITTSDSIIGQLLNVRHTIYRKSAIIVTGRPHIEGKLVEHGGDMGGLQIFEIQGLSNEQIEKYICKFSSSQEGIRSIIKAKTSLKRNFSILHVPQFLNTFCCVAILTKGEVINNAAELYSWTVYLLLTQHDVYKSDTSKTRIPNVFAKYSKLLMNTSEICYTLLSQNKIIFEGKIDYMDDDTETGYYFLRSLFVDASDNFTERYHFKHLSIMEFLAALYICSNSSNYKTKIEATLRKGFTEVVSFVCCLMAGLSSKGIIHEILEKVANLTAKDNIPFLKDVISVLNGPELHDVLDRRARFERSIEFVSYFVNKELKDKKLILSIISQLQYDATCLYDGNDRNLFNNILDICNDCVELLKYDVETIRMAFKNICFEAFSVERELNNINIINFLECKRIYLEKMKLDGNSIPIALDKSCQFGKAKRLIIMDCQLTGDSIVVSKESNVHLALLFIKRCKIDADSFINLCEMAMKSEVFRLYDVDIESSWWDSLTEMILKSNTKRELYLSQLDIRHCDSSLNGDMQMKVC